MPVNLVIADETIARLTDLVKRFDACTMGTIEHVNVRGALVAFAYETIGAINAAKTVEEAHANDETEAGYDDPNVAALPKSTLNATLTAMIEKCFGYTPDMYKLPKEGVLTDFYRGVQNARVVPLRPNMGEIRNMGRSIEFNTRTGADLRKVPATLEKITSAFEGFCPCCGSTAIVQRSTMTTTEYQCTPCQLDWKVTTDGEAGTSD
jgi:hypothetical protein